MWRTFKQQSRQLSTVSRAYKIGAARPSDAQRGQVGSDLALHASLLLAKLNEADKTLQIDITSLKPSTVVRNLGVPC